MHQKSSNIVQVHYVAQDLGRPTFFCQPALLLWQPFNAFIECNLRQPTPPA